MPLLEEEALLVEMRVRCCGAAVAELERDAGVLLEEDTVPPLVDVSMFDERTVEDVLLLPAPEVIACPGREEPALLVLLTAEPELLLPRNDVLLPVPTVARPVFAVPLFDPYLPEAYSLEAEERPLL